MLWGWVYEELFEFDDDDDNFFGLQRTDKDLQW